MVWYVNGEDILRPNVILSKQAGFDIYMINVTNIQNIDTGEYKCVGVYHGKIRDHIGILEVIKRKPSSATGMLIGLPLQDSLKELKK